jgi:hypothetical protein
MRNVITQGGQRVRNHDVGADPVILIERNRPMIEQVEQGLLLVAEIEAASEDHDRSGIRASDRRHELPHEKLISREPLDDGSEHQEVSLGKGLQEPIIHYVPPDEDLLNLPSNR